MRVLLVYPEFPDTFWSFKYALKFTSKKSVFPPLGLLTVAAMLPQEWEKKLIDMNVRRLRDGDIAWADCVFISAMSIQSASAHSVITRCKRAGVRVAVGGPLFTACPEKYKMVDHLILNEAEITLPPFLNDLEKGCAAHIYTSDEKPDITQTPVPLWSLIRMKDYSSMNIQYSRGCPFNCEFCDVVVLFGRKPRLKTARQVTAELDALYDDGWRGTVFFVDDNFIGNKEALKSSVLPAAITWQEAHGYPFHFDTEASINIADDEELMQLMVSAGFRQVFVGIETPNEDSLSECGKNQNCGRDLLACIETIQSHGMEVQGGFILGFDSDPDTIFDTLTRFIQQSGIVVAMVGLLNAPRGTRLYQRMEKEHRLTSDFTGDNTDYSMNFTPKMAYDKLVSGYKNVVASIYGPESYYQRVTRYLDAERTLTRKPVKLCPGDVVSFLKSVFRLGIVGKERRLFWRLLLHTLRHNPAQLQKAVTYAVYGHHFRKVYRV
jgi:radical SAM superfamily enzyme YgiQ (UPF0313 family)